MIGAIIGDIVGSKYEFKNIKTKDFPLFSQGCNYTDDTIMTLAIANAFVISRREKLDFKTACIMEMKRLGKKYPNPQGGYGYRFANWLTSDNSLPYNSFGNGSAMRVSPCGFIAVSLAEALYLAKESAEVTHNHPEGIKGAQAVSGAIFLAKEGKSKHEIRAFIERNFYDLDKSLDEIRPDYEFNETCQDTVPQAIVAFLESNSFEDAIRNAVSIGGDCDTLTAITGSIAWAFYVSYYEHAYPEHWHGHEKALYDEAILYLPDEFKVIIKEFTNNVIGRLGSYGRTGFAYPIPHNKIVLDDSFSVLHPDAITLERIPLNKALNKLPKVSLAEALLFEDDFVKTIRDFQIGIQNYPDYIEFTNRIYSNVTYLYYATLEECIVYLTYLWRADYMSGGYPDFNYRHRRELRILRVRIVDLLFEHLLFDCSCCSTENC